MPWSLEVLSEGSYCQVSVGVWEALDQCVTLQACCKERSSSIFSESSLCLLGCRAFVIDTCPPHPPRDSEGKSIWWHRRDVGTQSSRRKCKCIHISWDLPKGLLTWVLNTNFTCPGIASSVRLSLPSTAWLSLREDYESSTSGRHTFCFP